MSAWWTSGRDAAPWPLDDTERDRVRRCLRGDEAAWADLYRQHAPGVARFLGRLVGGDDGVDDLVQEVFLGVLSSLPRYRGEARLSTWILGVATNVAMHHRRGEARRRARMAREAEREEWGDVRIGTPGAEVGAVARAELRVVAATLEEVPVDQRATWILAEVDGLDTGEVAAALGIPEGTVRSRLFHVRRRLLDALRDAGFARPGRRDDEVGNEGCLRLVRSGRDG